MITRNVRKTDSTVAIDGVRFQIPQQYSHFTSLLLRYARWDLGEAEIICQETKKSLCVIYPLNKVLNSSGHRKDIQQKENIIQTHIHHESECELLDLSRHQLPPLLAHCLKKHTEQFPLSGYISLKNGCKNDE